MVRGPKRLCNIARSQHDEASQHQIGAGDAFQSPEVSAIVLRGFFETPQGVLVAHPGVLVPEMPASPNQILGMRYFKAVTEFRLAVNPGTVFAQSMLDLADGNCN